MQANEQVLRLLYQALIEIRAEAHESKDAKIFHLADLLHTVPLQLDAGEDAEGFVKALRRRAQQKGIERWVTQSLERIETPEAAAA